jgi:hypothetical protein
MALLRIKRPEQLKEKDPAAFGRLLGLDRAPEVKTLRRRLTRLAAQHCAERLGAELARRRVDQPGRLMGFLYVDSQVRLSRTMRDPHKCLRGAAPSGDARDHRLMDQRQLWRPVTGEYRGGPCCFIRRLCPGYCAKHATWSVSERSRSLLVSGDLDKHRTYHDHRLTFFSHQSFC